MSRQMTPANPPDRPPVNEPPVSATRSDGPVNDRARELLGEATFLCARLRDLDWSDHDSVTRDFYGHVEPSLERLERLLAEPAETVKVMEGWVLVPQVALDWLDGSGPDHKGLWFNQAPSEGRPRPYWWRSHFRKIRAALAAASTPTSTEKG